MASILKGFIQNPTVINKNPTIKNPRISISEIESRFCLFSLLHFIIVYCKCYYNWPSLQMRCKADIFITIRIRCTFKVVLSMFLKKMFHCV